MNFDQPPPLSVGDAHTKTCNALHTKTPKTNTCSSIHFVLKVDVMFSQAHSENCGKRQSASSSLYVLLTVYPSIWNSSVPTRRIFMKCYISIFFENLPRKIKLH